MTVEVAPDLAREAAELDVAVEQTSRPSRSARAIEIAFMIVAGLACAAAAYHIVTLAVTLAIRLPYPYDLEWMEGGMLSHSLRILDGEPLYGPPSVDFVPYLYTPLYPAVVAGLGAPFGVSYVLARAVSVLSIAIVCFLAYRICRREGSRVGGVIAVGLIAASFPFTGAWYDIARNDSLFLALVSGTIVLIRYHHRSLAACAGAGVLIVAAFFAKQTASLFGIAAGLMLMVLSFRGAIVYGVVAAVTWASSVWLYNSATDGWFWRWIYQMHQKHDFNQERAYDYTPAQFWDHMPTATKLTLIAIALGFVYFVWAGVLALARRRRADDAPAPRPRLDQPTVGFVYWTFFGAVGFTVSAIGFGTEFSWFNAFMPGTTFAAIAAGVAIAELGRHGGAIAGGPPARRAAGRAVAIALAAVLMAFELHRLVWSPSEFVPEKRDRRAGAVLIDLIRKTPGEVLVFSHPFYAHLAGKRPFLHRMGIRDVLAAKLGYPKGLEEGIRAKRWSLIVVDDKVEWEQLPGLRGNYKLLRDLEPDDMMRAFTGAKTRPKKLYVPVTEK